MSVTLQTRSARIRAPIVQPPAGGGSVQPADRNQPEVRVERSVHVSHGIHRGQFPVAGMTIRDARQTLVRLLNIDPAAVPVIDGRVVDGDTIIREEIAMLSFVKPSALKGRDVLVTHGIHSGHFPVAGMSVREARAALEPLLNIDPAAVPVVDGRVVDDESVIREGIGMLSFQKPSATKCRAIWSNE